MDRALNCKSYLHVDIAMYDLDLHRDAMLVLLPKQQRIEQTARMTLWNPSCEVTIRVIMMPRDRIRRSPDPAGRKRICTRSSSFDMLQDYLH